MSIVVIEDHEGIRNSLKELFELRNMRVFVAASAIEGLVLISRHKPKLLITDVMMPEMDGFELVSKLRTQPEFEHLPIIFLTAKTGLEDRFKGLNLGAIDYINKPFQSFELFKKVENILRISDFRPFTEKQLVPGDSNDDFIKRLDECISKHIQNPDLGIDTLAKEIPYSVSAIHKKIKQITGKSTNQYIREYRLNEANRWLTSRTIPISEVASRLGFNSLSYFSKSYKVYFGYSPKNNSKLPNHW
jgi:YesN/AraC family two-component response regulator